MATIVATASGGTRNWSDTATWVGGVVPTAADDVQLDGTSGAVSITNGALCRSLDCTGYTGTLTHNASAQITIGDATAGAGNVALKLVAGMTYTIGGPTSSLIVFGSTSATVQTITWAGKTAPTVNINGAGGSWQLQDTWTAPLTTVNLITGTLDTNSQTCSWAAFVSSVANTRTLTLGSSAITLSQNGGNAITALQSAMTVTANTSTVTITGTGTAISNGGVNWNGMSIVLNGASIQTIGLGTWLNVTRTGTAVKTDMLGLSGNPTITGTLTINGNSVLNRVLVTSTVAGTVRTVTAAAVSVTNADFMDTTGAGAGSWNLSGITGGSGDCGGNTGITFTTAAPQTWQGTSGGSWSDVTKWTSRVPLPQDDVTINAAFSASQTVTWDMPRLGHNIDFTGSTGGVTLNPSLSVTICGSLNLTGIGMLSAGSGSTLTFNGRGTHTITSAGFSWGRNVVVQGGTYSLGDAFVTTVQSFNVTVGTFNTNNQNITAETFSANGAGVVVNLGSSTLNLTSTTNANTLLRTGGATMNGNTATINILGVGSGNHSVAVTGSNFATTTINYTVSGSTGPLILFTPCTLGTINFSDASNARTLYIVTGSTASFTAFNVQGTPGKLMSVMSCNSSMVASPGVSHTISKISGYVSGDYLNIQDSTATGGASWYAGANSTNVSNNSGWFFQAYSPSKFLELM